MWLSRRLNRICADRRVHCLGLAFPLKGFDALVPNCRLIDSIDEIGDGQNDANPSILWNDCLYNLLRLFVGRSLHDLNRVPRIDHLVLPKEHSKEVLSHSFCWLDLSLFHSEWRQVNKYRRATQSIDRSYLDEIGVMIPIGGLNLLIRHARDCPDS